MVLIIVIFFVAVPYQLLLYSHYTGIKNLIKIAGFSTWWCCFVWLTSAAIGIAYQSYFATV